MSHRHEYGSGADVCETRNPASPAEAIGRYGVPDAAEVAAIVERAVPLAGGGAKEGADPDGGHFFRPAILGDVRHECIAGQEEIFGPVLSVVEYDSFDQAAEMLNGAKNSGVGAYSAGPTAVNFCTFECAAYVAS